MGTVELCEKIGASKDKEIAIMSFLSIAWEWKKKYLQSVSQALEYIFSGKREYSIRPNIVHFGNCTDRKGVSRCALYNPDFAPL